LSFLHSHLIMMVVTMSTIICFFFQAEDGIRDDLVTGVQTCALPISVSRDDLVDFLAGLYRQRLESKSVARHLVSLRNFFRFAQIQELIPEDPSANLESPKIRRSLPGYLRLEEVERLLALPDAKTH